MDISFNGSSEAREVLETLRKYGFRPGQYSKIVVSWGWEVAAKDEAVNRGIELCDFRDILKEIADSSEKKRVYFTDDTLRTLQLYARAQKSVDKVVFELNDYRKIQACIVFRGETANASPRGAFGGMSEHLELRSAGLVQSG